MSKIEVLQQILNTDQTNASVWYLLGLEYMEAEDTKQALEAFTNAMQHGDGELKGKILGELAKLAKATPGSAAPMPAARTTTVDEAEDEPEDTSQSRKIRVIPGGKGSVVQLDLPPRSDVRFQDVGGLHDVKKAIEMKIIKPFTSPGLFQKFRKKVGGGILLYGPPGCGKTYIARATAGECQAQFMTVHISDVLDPYLGVSEQKLHDLFSSARASKPCILFFDEIDALGFNRGKMSNDTMRTVIDALLAEIEGVDADTDRILVVGATNTPWDVDPAFKRPGRFDRMIFVAPPDLEARQTIFQLKLKDRPVEGIDLLKLAELTDLYSGADIENVVELATESVIEEIMSTGVERPIGMTDLVEGIQKTHASTIDWLRTVRNYVKYANQGGLYDEVQTFLNQHKKVL